MIGLPTFRGIVDRVRYNQAVMADSPVAYWRFGNNANDEVGSYNGTSVGSPSYADGVTQDGNKAVIFASAGQRVDSLLGFNFDQSVTVEAWVNPRAVEDLVRYVFTGHNSGNTGFQGPLLALMGATLGSGAANNSVRFQVGQSPTTYRTTSTTIPANQWSHIVATYATGGLASPTTSIKIYINGVEASYYDSSATGTTGQTYNGSIAGRRYDNARQFYGNLDEVAIYQTALSAAKVLAHYNAARAYEKQLADFIAATGATDTNTINNLCNYLWDQGLWTSCRFFPFKSTQNFPTGTTVKGLGGWTTNDIALFGSVANPTTAGRAFDATDDRGTWNGTGIETLSELYTFDRQAPTNASLADANRIGIICIGDDGTLKSLLPRHASTAALTGETTSIRLQNGADIRAMGANSSWSAGQDLQFVSRMAQTGSDIWRSKATTTKVTPSGTQDFRPSQATYATDSIVNVSAVRNGSTYSLFVATTRIALLFCKTSLTQTQRETITDFIDAL